MRVVTIEYRRLVNLGNYSSEHLTATAEIAADEDPAAAFAALKTYVHQQLGLIAAPSDDLDDDERPF